jgi:hypothetical protein
MRLPARDAVCALLSSFGEVEDLVRRIGWDQPTGALRCGSSGRRYAPPKDDREKNGMLQPRQREAGAATSRDDRHLILASRSLAMLAPRLLPKDGIGDLGILEDAGRPGADAAAAGAAERAATRHPHLHPLRLDAAREDRIRLRPLRRGYGWVFELGLEEGFAGVGWRRGTAGHRR